MRWITRVPATLSEAQAALVQAAPQTMFPLVEGYRSQELASTYGGVAQRWVLIDSEPRQLPAQRTVDQQLRTHSAQAVKACKKRCGTAFACEADAQQARATFAQGLQAPFLATSSVGPTSCRRGRCLGQSFPAILA